MLYPNCVPVCSFKAWNIWAARASWSRCGSVQCSGRSIWRGFSCSVWLNRSRCIWAFGCDFVMWWRVVDILQEYVDRISKICPAPSSIVSDPTGKRSLVVGDGSGRSMWLWIGLIRLWWVLLALMRWSELLEHLVTRSFGLIWECRCEVWKQCCGWNFSFHCHTWYSSSYEKGRVAIIKGGFSPFAESILKRMIFWDWWRLSVEVFSQFGWQDRSLIFVVKATFDPTVYLPTHELRLVIPLELELSEVVSESLYSRRVLSGFFMPMRKTSLFCSSEANQLMRRIRAAGKEGNVCRPLFGSGSCSWTGPGVAVAGATARPGPRVEKVLIPCWSIRDLISDLRQRLSQWACGAIHETCSYLEPLDPTKIGLDHVCIQNTDLSKKYAPLCFLIWIEICDFNVFKLDAAKTKQINVEQPHCPLILPFFPCCPDVIQIPQSWVVYLTGICSQISTLARNAFGFNWKRWFQALQGQPANVNIIGIGVLTWTMHRLQTYGVFKFAEKTTRVCQSCDRQGETSKFLTQAAWELRVC